jgi:hypothetical protein
MMEAIRRSSVVSSKKGWNIVLPGDVGRVRANLNKLVGNEKPRNGLLDFAFQLPEEFLKES